MRISDWSSDVCSSDLAADDRRRRAAAPDHFAEVEAAEGVRGHACATVARRRGGHLRQRHADDRIGEDATAAGAAGGAVAHARAPHSARRPLPPGRSEEHTSELQSLMRISYAVLCFKTKTNNNINRHTTTNTHYHIVQ